MDATELMRGDWVYIEQNPKPRQVDWIRSGEVGLLWDLIVTPPYLKPIPLTPEILEKNGFVIKKKWAQIGNFGDSPLIMWHFVDEPVLGDFKHELEIHQNDTGKVHVHIPCEYVHQLQHALKLCRIDKTIEL